ncbi:MFS general substrate transporter [Linderina pennispora]|uniref:MFS general substrate transporter n=1 Tax=Linderina pennispora TaxID=61395 RepID=A0A1Y1WBH0_9FUNG|nr:MFS general substrate transporter [Linderina pennispora]ORX70792.1 MFS general substrate transporter [Linderina pennispora]
MTNALAGAASTLGAFVSSYAYLNTNLPPYIKSNLSNFAMFGTAIIGSIILLLNFKHENYKRETKAVDISRLTEEEAVSALIDIDHLTPDEEQDARLLLFLAFGMCTAHLNRAVISFAKIMGMEKHLHMSGTQSVLAKYIPTMIFISGALSVFILAIKNFSGMIAVRPIYSWQWLYLLVGGLAMLSGIYGWVFIRDYPDTASYLNDEERELIGRVMARSNLRASDSVVISRRQIVEGLTDWRLMVFMVIDFANAYASASASTWAPVLMHSVGYNTSTVMGLLIIPSVCAGTMAASTGFIARKVGKMGVFQIILSLGAAAIMIIAVFGAENKVARTFSIIALPLFTTPAAVVGPAWLNINMRGTDRSAMTNAFTVAASTLGAFANSYTYLNTDAPLYIKGSSSNFAMFGASIIGSIILLVDFKRENAKRDANPMDISDLTEEEVKALGNKHPSFRYTL